MDMFELLTGESSQTPARSNKPKPWGSRQDRIKARSEEQPRKSNSKPEEVSDRTWSIAQFWLQEGERTFGQRPPVNLAEFSRRLHARIHESPEVRTALSEAEGRNPAECGADWVEDLVMQMVTHFWDSREQGDSLTPGLQFKFLVDDWDRLEDRAKTTLRVRRILQDPKPVQIEHVAKDENPYLRALANSSVTNYIQAGLAESENSAPIRKGIRKRPSKRAI